MIVINQLLLTFLLNAVWQIALIALVATVGDLLFRNTSPRYRHALWVVTLGLALTVPALTSVWLLRDSLVSSAIPAAAVGRQDLEPSVSTGVAGPEVAAATFVIWLGTTMALGLAAAYLLIVFYRASRLFFAWRRTRTLAQSGYDASLPDVIAAGLSKCHSLIDVENVSILFSSLVRGPVTMGTKRPVIILPEKLLAETDESIIVSAIGHEMVHVSRRDYFLNLIYELIILPLSFHPAAMLVRRRINQTRELCCDERVAGRLLEAEEYARSLVKLAGAAANFGTSALTTTVGMGDADNLEVRVMSLLKASVTGPKRRNYLILAGLLIVAVSGIVIGGFGFRVGIIEVNAQQVEKSDSKIGYAVSNDNEEVKKLKQLIELRQKDLSQATDESTASLLRADINKLKAELASKTLGAIKSDLDERDRHFVEEYKAQLAVEEPNLTQDQVKEHVEKALIARRSRFDTVADDPSLPPTIDKSLGNPMDHAIRLTAKPRPTSRGCEGTGGKSIAKVAFLSDGTIGEVTWVEMSSCSIFNDSVMQAIREIKFEPEVREGVAVTTTKQIEYVWANY